MLRSRRLEPVLDVAAEAERQAAAAFAAGEARVGEAERKLAELEQYREDYRASLLRKTAGGIDATQLRTFHGFIARLGDAVAQQQAVLARVREERDLLRTRWTEAGRRARTVGKAVEQATREERRQLERREQNDFDERAQRAFVAAGRARREEP